MDLTDATIGHRLRLWRIHRKMTQERLSEASGVAVSTIGAIEAGEQDARVSTLRTLSGALDCSLADLTGDMAKSASGDSAASGAK